MDKDSLKKITIQENMNILILNNLKDIFINTKGEIPLTKNNEQTKNNVQVNFSSNIIKSLETFNTGKNKLNNNTGNTNNTGNSSSNQDIKPKRKSKFDENTIIDYINSEILITDIMRPFSIKLLQIDLLHNKFTINEKQDKLNIASTIFLKIKVSYLIIIIDTSFLRK